MKARFLWRAWRARYRDQAAELAAIRANLGPTDLACDIGANKGSYLYWMSRWAGQVVAFEPQPGLATYLSDACRSVGIANVTIERSGVSDVSGTRNLYVPSENSPEASLVCHADARSIPISVVALDDYFEPSQRVALLKIDVEGGELDVLKGAERILRQHRPVLLMECEQRHLSQGTVLDCLQYLAALGYDGQFFDRGRAVPVADFDPAVHQAPVGEQFWTAPTYCNNFVFTPA
ncbi:MAG: FkbM family methyltransferase [Brevundimonas sp.]